MYYYIHVVVLCHCILFVPSLFQPGRERALPVLLVPELVHGLGADRLLLRGSFVRCFVFLICSLVVVDYLIIFLTIQYVCSCGVLIRSVF